METAPEASQSLAEPDGSSRAPPPRRKPKTGEEVGREDGQREIGGGFQQGQADPNSFQKEDDRTASLTPYKVTKEVRRITKRSFTSTIEA